MRRCSTRAMRNPPRVPQQPPVKDIPMMFPIWYTHNRYPLPHVAVAHTDRRTPWSAKQHSSAPYTSYNPSPNATDF